LITLAMTTVVAAPRATVWSALSSPEQIARWRPGVEGILETSAEEVRVGRRLRFRCRLHDVPVTLEEQAVEVLAGRRLRSNVRFGLFHCEETLTLAVTGPSGQHTRVSLRIATPSETPLLGASLDRFAVRRFGTELASTCLSALRDWCELGRLPSPSLPATRTTETLLRDPA
jgi:uncharacterized protein YndB with AHSA1/START domain